jgi:probable HAF family extracellular repeat protein
MKLRCFFTLLIGLCCLTPRSWAQTYTVIDLGWNGSTPGGGAPHSFINNRGQVAGSGNYPTYLCTHGYLYSGGVTTDIGSLGACPTQVGGINDSGDVVGSSTTTSGATHAFLYTGGQMQDLGTLPGDSYSNATGINDRGEIIGSSSTGPPPAAGRAFLYSGGKMKPLGPAIREPDVAAFAINNGGDIVGSFTATNGFTHAFLYVNKTVADLGALIDGGNANSTAVGINNAGQVIISAEPQAAFLYSAGQMIAIPAYPGGDPDLMYPIGINNRGQVVGDSTVCCPYDGFLYRGGKTINLNTLGLPIFVLVAFDINDSGQIPVWTAETGEEYFLTPTP